MVHKEFKCCTADANMATSDVTQYACRPHLINGAGNEAADGFACSKHVRK